jgi:hypothetical protein
MQEMSWYQFRAGAALPNPAWGRHFVSVPSHRYGDESLSIFLSKGYGKSQFNRLKVS